MPNTVFISKNKALTAVKHTRMDTYKIIKEVGNGTFGTVWRALNKVTGEVVAIKRMKKSYYSWEECINLREVKSLRKMNHPNIVRLKEVIRENNILYFVFEYMECNLYHLMKDRNRYFSEDEVKNWCFQVFQGLAYMHQRGYFHRDLKPENLLVSNKIIKIADFGLAREINSQPPYTEYVSTRWYRAPEVLLQSSSYGPAVDMWAMGAIMAELFNLRAIFPGSSEADEIYKICSVIGTPTESQWADGLQLANIINYQFPQVSGVPISALLPSASEEAVNLITLLCSWDPCKRPTAAEALQHPFFKSCFYVPPFLRPKSALTKTPPSAGTKGSLVSKQGRNYSETLPNPKCSNKLNKSSGSLYAGVHRKLEMNLQEEQKYSKTLSKQPLKYQPPPAKKAPIAKPIGKTLSKTSEKLANMAIESKSAEELPPKKEQKSSSLPMKAGGWHVQPTHHPFMGKPQDDVPGGRTYTRKVAGW